jgi:hypothetical protein
MRKRNEDPADGSLMTEIDNLKSKVALMEETIKAQALEFKSKLATSHAKMQLEIKEQLDNFLATFLKL